MGVTEEDVGILCYASDHPGFNAVLKHRYSDFLVNEVDPQGRVVHLTQLDVPTTSVKQCRDNSREGVTEPQAAPMSIDAGRPELDAIERFAALAGQTNAGKLAKLLERIVNSQTASNSCHDQPMDSVLLEDHMEDKQHRKACHMFFKDLPGLPKLATETVVLTEGQGESHTVRTCIRVGFSSSTSHKTPPGKGRKPCWKRDATGWAGGDKKYVHFVLYKENMDNQVALNTLGRLLRVPTSVFRIAGTKDKRGITVQRVSGFKIAPDRLAGLNARLFGLKVGNFSFAGDNLYVGQLAGNQFEIVLRNVDGLDDKMVQLLCESLKTRGFINYFGLQRFGSRVPTHHIGLTLLKGDWCEAAALVLRGWEDDGSELLEARRLVCEHKDFKGALKLLPRAFVSERRLLEGYIQHGSNNHLNALFAIPVNIRTMYVHAYQSYLWNHAASHRVKHYGAENVVPGDLVLLKSVSKAAINSGVCVATAGTGSFGDHSTLQVDEAGVEQEAKEIQHEEHLRNEEQGASLERTKHVHIVSSEEAQAGTFTIEDVVLPLPGSRVIYPQHDTAKIYTDLVAKNGVALTECPHNVREFSLPNLGGDYRRLICKLPEASCSLFKYGDPDEIVSRTDLDVLRDSGAKWSDWPRKEKTAVVRKRRLAEERAGGVEDKVEIAGKHVECDVGDDLEGDKQAAPEGSELILTGGQKKRKVCEFNVFAAETGTCQQDHGEEKTIANFDNEKLGHPVDTARKATKGELTGLAVKFVLPASSYATMVVRELMKGSVSKTEHMEKSKCVGAGLGSQ